MTNAPSVAPMPVALSRTDMEAYERDGFIACPRAFGAAEIAALRARLEDPTIWSPHERAQAGHQHLVGLVARHPDFLALARDPRIVGRVASLIGPDVQLQHSKLAAQAASAGRGGSDWHQDFAFFPHSNTDLVAVMVMIDDHAPTNGCMRMLRGSHRLGLLEHRREGAFTGACQDPRWQGRESEWVDLALPAGSISFHHCLTLHGAPPNPTGAPRRGLVFQYRAADAHQFADILFPETGLQVAGSYRDEIRCTITSTWIPARASWYPSDTPHGSVWNQSGELARRENGSGGTPRGMADS